MLKCCSAGRAGFGRAGLASLCCFALLALLLPLAAAAADLLEKRESLYNNIFIFGDADNVSMTFGQNKRYYTESSMKLSDPGALTVDYTRFMTLGVAYPPKLDRIGTPSEDHDFGRRRKLIERAQKRDMRLRVAFECAPCGPQRARPGQQPVCDRDDREQDELLAVHEADLRIDGERRRHERCDAVREEAAGRSARAGRHTCPQVDGF